MYNYKFNTKKLIDDVQKSIATVVINKKKYKELINIIYYFKFDFKILSKYIEPPTNEDLNERRYLSTELVGAIIKLIGEMNTRRAICHNHSQETIRCVPICHYYIRDNKLFLNVYFRSQCLDNFLYDKQTLILLLFKVYCALKTVYKNLDYGTITVFCANFHSRISNKKGRQ